MTTSGSRVPPSAHHKQDATSFPCTCVDRWTVPGGHGLYAYFSSLGHLRIPLKKDTQTGFPLRTNRKNTKTTDFFYIALRNRTTYHFPLRFDRLGDTTLRLVWLVFGRSRTKPTKCPTMDLSKTRKMNVPTVIARIALESKMTPAKRLTILVRFLATVSDRSAVPPIPLTTFDIDRCVRGGK